MKDQYQTSETNRHALIGRRMGENTANPEATFFKWILCLSKEETGPVRRTLAERLRAPPKGVDNPY